MEKNTFKKTTTTKRKKKLIILLPIILLALSITYFFNQDNIKILSSQAVPYKSKYVDAGNTVSKNEWFLVLVNRWNPISTNTNIEKIELSNGQSVDKRIYPFLQKMFEDARSKGVEPFVVSGYRTFEEQEQIYNDKISAYKSEGHSDSQAKK